jgi:hypothetical protein
VAGGENVEDDGRGEFVPLTVGAVWHGQ